MGLKTPVALITGSRGSGTTLLKRILGMTDRRLAVLMGRSGEVAIGGRVTHSENVEFVELTHGSICCELTGELEAGVSEIIEKVHPEFIVVEGTGVAEADALTYEVENSLPQHARLDSVICIVDAYMMIKYHVGYDVRAQLKSADIVLINKIGMVAPEEVKEVEAQVRECNDTAMVFKTVRCDVDVDLLFGLDIEEHTVPVADYSNEDFESLTFTTDRPLEGKKFQQVIDHLPSSVYRAKGFARFEEGGYFFTYVAGRSDLEKSHADKTQLVFVGLHLNEMRDTILSQLSGYNSGYNKV